MLGTVYVECEEHTCVYYGNGRCIAERIKMVLQMDENLGLDNLVCDTYDHRDAWIPEPEYDPWAECEHDDWGDRD